MTELDTITPNNNILIHSGINASVRVIYKQEQSSLKCKQHEHWYRKPGSYPSKLVIRVSPACDNSYWSFLSKKGNTCSKWSIGNVFQLDRLI